MASALSTDLKFAYPQEYEQLRPRSNRWYLALVSLALLAFTATSIVSSCSNSYFASLEAKIAEMKAKEEKERDERHEHEDEHEQQHMRRLEYEDEDEEREGNDSELYDGEYDDEYAGGYNDDYYEDDDDGYAEQYAINYASDSQVSEIEAGFCGSLFVYTFW